MPKDHFLYDTTNKKVIGKFKSETNEKVITEFVGIRSKMYSVITNSDKKLLKCKGVKYGWTKKHLNHELYKKCVLS